MPISELDFPVTRLLEETAQVTGKCLLRVSLAGGSRGAVEGNGAAGGGVGGVAGGGGGASPTPHRLGTSAAVCKLMKDNYHSP